MGGNALKNCLTRRYDRDEYFNLERTVWRVLDTIFPNCPHEAIKAYATKESFGDMDIVISSDNLPANWVNLVQSAFAPAEMVKNGNCLSFEYRELQIDLITMPSENYRSALNYYAYNDLGNLMGRIADSMGLKYGHDGLSYRYTVGTNNYRNIPITKDLDTILTVLGFSHARYEQGFDTLEEIFLFVVMSMYFNTDIYLLENRDNKSRTRDAKRKTYMEFLDYLERYPDMLVNHLKSANKSYWLPFLFSMLPGFKEQYEQCETDYKNDQTYKSKFNGDLVSEWTGLKEKELGLFMKHLRDLRGPDDSSWRQWVVEHPVRETIRTVIGIQFALYNLVNKEEN